MQPGAQGGHPLDGGVEGGRIIFMAAAAVIGLPASNTRGDARQSEPAPAYDRAQARSVTGK